MGRLDAAEESLQNALRLRRRLLGTHAYVALTLEALAHVAFARGKPELAEQYMREQLEIVRTLNDRGFDQPAHLRCAVPDQGVRIVRRCRSTPVSPDP